MDVTLHRGTHYALTATGVTDASTEAVSKSGRVLRVFLEGIIGQSVAWVLLHGVLTYKASGTTVTASTVDDSFNTSGTWSNGRPVAGQYITTTGFVNAANNSTFLVVSATTSKIVVDANLTTEGGTPTTTVVGGSPIGVFRTDSGASSFPWPIHFTPQLFVGQIGQHTGTISIEYE